jgi:hypothetical protein
MKTIQSNLLAELARLIEEATPNDYPVLCGELERLKASLWLKMACPARDNQAAQPDCLLTAEQVAERLHISTDYVYRHARQYPFMIREGRNVRFSQVGLDRYLRQRQGR